VSNKYCVVGFFSVLLSVSLDCPFLVALSVFSYVCLYWVVSHRIGFCTFIYFKHFVFRNIIGQHKKTLCTFHFQIVADSNANSLSASFYRVPVYIYWYYMLSDCTKFNSWLELLSRLSPFVSLLRQTFKLFGFLIFWLWAYLMKVILICWLWAYLSTLIVKRLE
jgi:hypothetical protein